MELSKVALVLWEPDYEELEARLRNNCDAQTCDVFDEYGVFETPDEKYVCLYADYTKWNTWDDYTAESFVMSFIKDIRHSYIRVGESVDDIDIDFKTWDDRGSDEEFENFLSTDRSIGGLCDFGINVGKPKIYRDTLASLIDTVEDFLEKKGVSIDNLEKEGDDGEAIIVGSDYDSLEASFKAVLEDSGLDVDNEYGRVA